MRSLIEEGKLPAELWLEFAMVDTLDPQFLGPRMELLCGIFVLATLTGHATAGRTAL
ncbi:MAG: hypothetical protein OSA45_01130 [Halioglobus sp.]|nr:hypothetical protein [Halioglobus sp.]